jgi:hypothetical protein
MKLFQIKIDHKTWLSLLNNIGVEKKWLLSVKNQDNTDFMSLNFFSVNEDLIQIGATSFARYDDIIDCSIFIFPEYLRKGFAKKYVIQLISVFKNIQFTVSKYNINSMKLFESISELKKSELNMRTKTYRFYK